jgi:hypothetical protein
MSTEKDIREKVLPEGITQAMIDEAKAKHGESKVKFIDLPLDDDSTAFKTVLACVPTRTVIGQYQTYSDKQPKKAEDILVKACLLSHKDEVLADDSLFYGALTGICELIPIRKGIVKNC